MKILVIHNSQDQARAENIKIQFASQNTKHEHELIDATMYPSQPSVGIKRSFCKAIQKAKDNDWLDVMILEDDFKALCEGSISMMMKTWHEYPLIDGVLLGSIYEGTPQILGEGVAQVKDKFSALNSIIIPSNLYDKILNAEEPYHLDYWLGQIAKIPIYVCYPFLIIQNDGFSYNTKTITEYNRGLNLKYKLIDKKQ